MAPIFAFLTFHIGRRLADPGRIPLICRVQSDFMLVVLFVPGRGHISEMAPDRMSPENKRGSKRQQRHARQNERQTKKGCANLQPGVQQNKRCLSPFHSPEYKANLDNSSCPGPANREGQQHEQTQQRRQGIAVPKEMHSHQDDAKNRPQQGDNTHHARCPAPCSARNGLSIQCNSLTRRRAVRFSLKTNTVIFFKTAACARWKRSVGIFR